MQKLTTMQKLKGKRIISLSQLQQQMEVIANHTPSWKSYSGITVKEKQREGLASVFTIRCNACSAEFTLPN